MIFYGTAYQKSQSAACLDSLKPLLGGLDLVLATMVYDTTVRLALHRLLTQGRVLINRMFYYINLHTCGDGAARLLLKISP